MILTKEIANKAKKLVGTNGWLKNTGKLCGVCLALEKASKGIILVYDRPLKFFGPTVDRKGLFYWQMTPEGDIKRRAFIESLIGKDL